MKKLLIYSQMSLLLFLNQWNANMDRKKIAGNVGRSTSTIPNHLIQGIDRRSDQIFGEDHKLEPHIIYPMVQPLNLPRQEQELLGLEYAMDQSNFDSHYLSQE